MTTKSKRSFVFDSTVLGCFNVGVDLPNVKKRQNPMMPFPQVSS
jgi:hypothetical protein